MVNSKKMAELFDIKSQAITRHLKKYTMMKNYSKKQLVPKWNKFKLKATVKWISIMQSKNTRDFSREMN